MICSTLNGMMVIKHPKTGVLVREDGMVFQRKQRNINNYGWTKGCKAKDGYRVISIRGKQHSVHRLVAEAFLPNPENKPTVDHINRIRDDNRVQNLRWATSKEQMENNTRVLNRADYGSRQCENKSEYDRNYHQAHRGEILTRQHEYHKANRDEILARKRKYDAEHKDEKREYDRKRREKKKQSKLETQER